MDSSPLNDSVRFQILAGNKINGSKKTEDTELIRVIDMDGKESSVKYYATGRQKKAARGWKSLDV